MNDETLFVGGCHGIHELTHDEFADFRKASGWAACAALALLGAFVTCAWLLH